MFIQAISSPRTGAFRQSVRSVPTRTMRAHLVFTPHLYRSTHRFFAIPAPTYVSQSRKLLLVLGGVIAGVTIWQFIEHKQTLAEEEASGDVFNLKAHGGRDAACTVHVHIKDSETGLPIKNLSDIDKPNPNFVSRKSLEQQIEQVLSEGNVCYLRGSGGFGKTQLALHYVEKNKEQYSHLLFINCEDSASLRNSLEKIARTFNDFRNETGSIEQTKDIVLKFIDKNNSYLKDKKILIIIDNIDNSTVSKHVQPFLQANISGNILATGRLDSGNFNNMRLKEVSVNRATADEAYTIFKNSLTLPGEKNPSYCKFFFDDHQRNKTENFLIQRLDGSPQLIQLVAGYIRSQRVHDTDQIIQLFSNDANLLNKQLFINYNIPAEEIGYRRSICGATIPNIQAIGEDFANMPGVNEIYYDFIYYLAFTTPYQKSEFHIDQNLIDILKSNSSKPAVYNQDVPELLVEFINRLDKHALLVRSTTEKGDLVLDLPLNVKWAIIFTFFQKYENLRFEIEQKIQDFEKNAQNWSLDWLANLTYISTVERFKTNHYYDLDKQRYKWFYAGIKYITLTKSKDLYSLSYIVEFIQKFIKSPKFATEILNTLYSSLSELTTGLSRLSSSTNEFFQNVDKIELDSLEEIMKRAANLKIPGTSDALLSLSYLYTQVDLAKSEEILKMESVKSSGDYLFYYAHYYYSISLCAQDDAKKRHYLEQSIEKYEQHLPALSEAKRAPICNNLAVCYRMLAQISSTEEDKNNNLDNSERYYSRAIKANPLNPVYESGYGNLLHIAQRPDEATRRENIAKILDSDKFRSHSKAYQNKIVEFLRAEKSFLFSDSRISHTMEDRGDFFGGLINENKQIQTLQLYGCHLNDQAVAQIATCLITNTTLTSLQLEFNSEVTDKGIALLREALKSNTSLQKLCLSRNKSITAQAVEELIYVLGPGFTLELRANSFFRSNPFSSKEKQRIKIIAAQQKINILI